MFSIGLECVGGADPPPPPGPGPPHGYRLIAKLRLHCTAVLDGAGDSRVEMQLFAVTLFCCLAVVSVSGGADFKWPEKYTVSGSISLPYAEISEPFVAAVDMTKGMSMFSTYGGKAKVVV